MNGTNNEVSVASYFIALSNELDNVVPNWRESHILLLDNCTSHKTQMMRKVYANGGFKVIFSAPASYLAIPVERIFGLIKKQDLDDVKTPNLPVV